MLIPRAFPPSVRQNASNIYGRLERLAQLREMMCSPEGMGSGTAFLSLTPRNLFKNSKIIQKWFKNGLMPRLFLPFSIWKLKPETGAEK